MFTDCEDMHRLTFPFIQLKFIVHLLCQALFYLPLIIVRETGKEQINT